jgi:2-(1,2-epoxy-1,2-dihydrophenyl)acetyl-CoA isomerase
MDRAMMHELRDMLQLVAEDTRIRAVVLTGAGRAFSAGGDVNLIQERQAATAQPSVSSGSIIEEQLRLLRRHSESIELLLRMPKPVLASINGPAVGGGLCLALACDLRIASDEALLRVGYARMGLSGDFGITYLLSRAVCGSTARELLFLDPSIAAPDALRIHLVNRVVPSRELDGATTALARQLADGPTLAFGKMKENLLVAAEGNLAHSMQLESLNARVTALTADSREAAGAFAQKRLARFEGS